MFPNNATHIVNLNAIKLDNLAIGYITKKTKKIVAHSLSITIQMFQFTCLIGSNGIGKSTLIRTLSGLQDPLCGELFIYNQSIESYSKNELSKLISVILTEKINVQNMSVYELVSLGRSPYTSFFGKLSLKDKIIIEESLHLVQIEHLAYRFIDTLSDGEKQKAILAKTLAQQTPIIFLDEPTAFLDLESKKEVLKLLYEISKQKQKTVFLSTHDIELASQVSDTILLMNKESGLTLDFLQPLCKK